MERITGVNLIGDALGALRDGAAAFCFLSRPAIGVCDLVDLLGRGQVFEDALLQDAEDFLAAQVDRRDANRRPFDLTLEVDHRPRELRRRLVIGAGTARDDTTTVQSLRSEDPTS